MSDKRVEILVKPGTNPVPDATELETFYYTYTDKVYFSKGKLRKLPGWVSVLFSNGQTIRGAARSMFSYLTTIYRTIIGTNTRLYSYQNGALFNITPFDTTPIAIANSIATDYVALTNDPLATTLNSKDVVVTSAAHKLLIGDMVAISGATTTNGIPNTELNTIHIVRAATTNNFTFSVPTTAANATGFGGGASVISRTSILRITAALNGLSNGDRVKIEGATTTGGVPDTEINAEHIIRSVATNTFDIVVSTKATSPVSGGGGGATTYSPPIASGAIDYAQGLGYGGGLYGMGLYGVAKLFANAFIYPRIWSQGRFGNNWVGTPGGQNPIYIWQENTAVAPEILAGAPAAVNGVFVSSNAVVAYGINGVGNRIGASDTGDATNWVPGAATNAYEDDVEGAGTFISQAAAGNVNVLFTSNEAYTFTYIGKPDIWDAKELLRSDGIIAPNAHAMVEDAIFWAGQAFDIYRFDGGSITKIEYNTSLDWIIKNLNYQQSWKTFTRVDTKRNLIWFCFPTGTSTECNTYLLVNYLEQDCTLGTIDRSAAESPVATITSPYMVQSVSESVDGTLYRHDYGFNDDTSPMAVIAETNYVMIGEGDVTMEIMDIIPDSTQTGSVDLSIITKEYAQDTEEATYGPYEITPSTTFIDPQAEGRQRKYRFEQNALDEDFAMGKWFETIQKGTPI